MFDWLMIAATLYILVYIAATIAAFIFVWKILKRLFRK